MEWIPRDKAKYKVFRCSLSIYQAVISKEMGAWGKTPMYTAKILIEAPLGVMKELLTSSGTDIERLKKHCEVLLTVIQLGPWY